MHYKRLYVGLNFKYFNNRSLMLWPRAVARANSALILAAAVRAHDEESGLQRI